jgi:hypothetical protein
VTIFYLFQGIISPSFYEKIFGKTKPSIFLVRRIRNITRLIVLSFSFIGISKILLDVFTEIHRRNLFSFLDTPREVLVVLLSLFLILGSIACTTYFRPARMTVIAGVALGFIAAVLFAEGVFAAHDYMNRRLGH